VPGRLAVDASHALSSFCNHVRFAVRPALLEPDLDLVAILSSAVVAAAGAYDCNAVRKACCLVLGRLGACVDRSVLVALLASVGADSGRSRENSIHALAHLTESVAGARVMATDSSFGLSAALEDVITCPVHEQDSAVAACKLLATRALSLVPTCACLSKLAVMLRAAAGADRVALMNRIAELATDALRRTVIQDAAGLVAALHFVIIDESGDDRAVRVKACEVLCILDVPFPGLVVEHLLREVRDGARAQHLEAHATNALACVAQIAKQTCNHQGLLEPQHDLIALLLECLGESKPLALRRCALAVVRQLCCDVDLQVSAPPALKDEIHSLTIRLMLEDCVLPSSCRQHYIALLTCLQLTANTTAVAHWIAFLRNSPPVLSATSGVTDIVQFLSVKSQTAWALKNDATLCLVRALESTIGEAAAHGEVQALACKALNLLKRTISVDALVALTSIIGGTNGVRRHVALQSLLMLCELEANIVAIQNSIDMSLLERWVVDLNDGPCCKIILCSLMQKTKHAPSSGTLDALAACIASSCGQRRLCAVECLNRLATQEKLRALLVEPARGVVRRVLAVMSTAFGSVRRIASNTIGWLSETAALRPQLLQPDLDMVSVLLETIARPDGLIEDDFDSRFWACHVLWQLGVVVDQSVLALLVAAMAHEGADADKCVLRSVTCLARVHDHHAPLVDSALGLCAAFESMLARKCMHYHAIKSSVGLVKFEPSVAMLCSLQDVCRTESGTTRQKAIETLQSFAQTDTSKHTMRSADSGCREAMCAVIQDSSPMNVNRADACKLLSTLDLVPDEATMRAVVSCVTSADVLLHRSGLSCIASLAASHTIKMSVLSSALVADTLQSVAGAAQGGTLTLVCECIGLTSTVVKPELVEALSSKIASGSSVVALNAIRSLSSLLQTKTIAKSILAGQVSLSLTQFFMSMSPDLVS
jgi:hypothetical protein